MSQPEDSFLRRQEAQADVAQGGAGLVGGDAERERVFDLTEAQVEATAQAIRKGLEAGAEVTPAPNESMVRFRTGKPESELGQLLASLIGAGLRVTQFREVQTDLEDAFMTFARPNQPAAVGASH